MKCFYDLSKDAVGTCKSCGRGISVDHLTDMGKGLACKGRCEDDVKALIALIDRNIASYSATSQILKRGSNTGYGSATFLTVMGLIFTLTGVRESEMGFTLYLGIGFLAYGVWNFVRVYKYASIVAKLPDSTESQP